MIATTLYDLDISPGDYDHRLRIMAINPGIFTPAPGS